MRDYKIRYTEAAKKDIESLRYYLEKNFGREKANKFLKNLRDSITQLGEMPQLGRSAKDLSNLLVGYQFLHLPKNTIFYEAHDEARQVKVLRIYDNRRDILANLLEYLDKKEE